MADGQVLIDSKLNTSGVQKGTRELKEEFQDLAKVTEKVAEKMEKELDNTGSAADGASDSFKQLFKANLSADLVTGALKETGEAAIELGKQAVAAAADINASNAQFEQTFKGVEKVAKESLNAVAKQAGITATRMQDSYTSIFAFSKSIGADQAQALDISSRAMIAAADSAAYYDKSIEEATETLQSFLKGNFENDAALGIAATETTRNAKANEMYAKSFIELSEAQKVDVLLAMVEAGNEASGALGQAAREADSWTNVTGELNEAWRRLLGVLGDPTLEGLIPIIQGITGALKSLIDTSASSNLAAEMNSFRDSISNLDAEFEKSFEAIEKNAIMAELYKDRLLELEKEGFAPNTAASREYANAVDALNSIYPELNLQIDEQTGLLNENSKAQLNNLNAMKQKALYAAMENKLTAALNAQADARADVIQAEREQQKVEKELEIAQQELAQLTDLTAEEIVKLAENQGELIDTIAASSEALSTQQINMSELGEATKAVTPEMIELAKEFLGLETESAKLTDGIDRANTAIAEQDSVIESLKGECDDLAEKLGIVTEEEKETAAATDEAAKAQEELAKRFQDAKESARDSLDTTVGLFEELEVKSTTSSEKIVENWKTQQEAFSNYAQNLQAAIDMGLDETLVKQLADGSAESMAILQELVHGTGTNVEEINKEFRNLSKAKDTAATAMAGISEGVKVELDGVKDSINETLTGAGEGAAAAMETAAGAIQVSFTQPVQESMETLGSTIEETFENAADTMKTAWSDNAQWFESNVTSPIESSTEDMGKTMLETVEEMRSGSDTAWKQIAAEAGQQIDSMNGKIPSIGDTMHSTLAGMESDNAAAWQRMVEAVAKAIDQMQAKINSLKGKTVNVGVDRFSSPEFYVPAAASIGIPMVASGSVIPPSATYSVAAYHQGKEESQEETDARLRQIIQEELENIVLTNEINFAGELAPLARILYPEIRTEARRVGRNLAEEVLE